MFQVAKLFGLAYGRAATVRNAASGFRATGICPYDPLIFSDEDFSPSAVTDTPLDESGQDDEIQSNSLFSDHSANQQSNEIENLPTDLQNLDESAVLEESAASCHISNTDEEACCSSAAQFKKHIEKENHPSRPNYASVESISPLPKLIRPAGMKRRSASRATILTGSPHKQSVLTAIQKKNAAEKKKEANRNLKEQAEITLLKENCHFNLNWAVFTIGKNQLITFA